MNLGNEPKTPKEMVKHYMLSRHTQTFRELSEQSGIPLTTLHKKLKDPLSFKIREINHLCDALGMSPEDRIFMKGEKR